MMFLIFSQNILEMFCRFFEKIEIRIVDFIFEIVFFKVLLIMIVALVYMAVGHTLKLFGPSLKRRQIHSMN